MSRISLPNRRAFVAILSTAAAAVLLERPLRNALAPACGGDGANEGAACADDDRPRSTWSGTTRWIGHC
jgi:hypothetical protein